MLEEEVVVLFGFHPFGHHVKPQAVGQGNDGAGDGSIVGVNQRWQHYEAQMRDYRTWLGGLPANVAQRVAWGNAAALLGVDGR